MACSRVVAACSLSRNTRSSRHRQARRAARSTGRGTSPPAPADSGACRRRLRRSRARPAASSSQAASSPVCSASNSSQRKAGAEAARRTSRARCCRRTAADPAPQSPCRSCGQARRDEKDLQALPAARPAACTTPLPSVQPVRDQLRAGAASLPRVTRSLAQRQLDVMRPCSAPASATARWAASLPSTRRCAWPFAAAQRASSL